MEKLPSDVNGQTWQNTNNQSQNIKVNFGREGGMKQETEPHDHGNTSGPRPTMNIEIAQRENGRNRQNFEIHSTEADGQGGILRRHLAVKSEFEHISYPRYVQQAKPRGFVYNPGHPGPMNVQQARPRPVDTTALDILAEVAVRENTFLNNYAKSVAAKRQQE